MASRTALRVMREAGPCNACFDDPRGQLDRVQSGVPHPRWIGSRYADAVCRVALVLINPGQPGEDSWHRRETKVFRDFHAGESYEGVRDHYRACVARRDRWICRYIDLLGGDIEEIAQLNMAWCATKQNRYPTWMLDQCFRLYTGRLLEALDPHVVLLSGKSALSEFKPRVEKLLPNSRVRVISHYARNALGQAEPREVREWMRSSR